jgi:predicted GTPase
LTEIKAAAVDVVAEEADRRGTKVIFCDNIPVEIDGTRRLDELVKTQAIEAIEEFHRNND